MLRRNKKTRGKDGELLLKLCPRVVELVSKIQRWSIGFLLTFRLTVGIKRVFTR